MERYDQHVHSAYSFDSKERLEDECEAALQKGLQGITFTEHFSVDPLDVSYGVLRYDAYRQAVTDCQDKYRGRLHIGCGLEIGEPHLKKCEADLKQAVQSMQLDFIIGSIHNIGSVKLRTFQKGKTKDEIYTQYFQEILMMAETADIDVIGHLDLAKRYAFEVVGNYDFSEYRDRIAKILSVVIDRGLGIEINTSGWRNSVGVCYPSPEVIRLYHDLGGRYITISSDAHKNEDIASSWDRARQVLLEAGFDQYFYYEDRKPHAVSLRNETE